MILAITAISLGLISPVYADTSTLNPDAEGTYSGWIYVGGSGNYTNLQSDDDDETYAVATEKDRIQTVNVDDSDLSGTINFVTLHAKCKQTYSNEAIQLLIRTRGTDYFSVEYTLTTTYADYFYTWENNPYTGSAWTWSEINDLEVGLKSVKVGPVFDNIHCTRIWVVVDYTVEAFDFSLSASPTSLSVQQAGSVSSTVHVTLVSGAAATVNLNGSWLGTAPAGVTPSFCPSSGIPNFGSTLIFQTTAAATVGNFTYRVIGTGGGQTHTADISLEITELLLPVAPSLVSPENGITLDSSPTFDWSDAAGATSYVLQIATDNCFSNVVRAKDSIESNAVLSESEELSYGTHYYWRVRGKNAAGAGGWSSVWTFIAKLAAPKVMSFEIAAGAYTNSASVQLKIIALNAVQMSFSDDGITWGEWVPYQTSKSYTLPAEGHQKIYVRVKDAVGDISSTVSQSIILDRMPPSTIHSSSGHLGAEGYKGSVVVSLNATDITSDVGTTKYRIDGGEWQTGNTFVVSGDGPHAIDYFSIDMAGNEEEVKSFVVSVYTPLSPVPYGLFGGVVATAVVLGAIGWKVIPPRTKKRLERRRLKKKWLEKTGLIKRRRK